MRNLLEALGAPVWGTKAKMWPRLVHAETRRELQKRDGSKTPNEDISLVTKRGPQPLRWSPWQPQNPSRTAISTKSDETVHLTVMCTAFVKRMAYAKAVLKVDPELALRSLADKIANKAGADGIQLKVETTPEHWRRWASTRRTKRSVSMLASRVVTRLSLDVTLAMDVWPWLVRHVGWLLERYHVKANKKTAFEECFGKPYQGEVMKFAEAALFHMDVSPSRRIRTVPSGRVP